MRSSGKPLWCGGPPLSYSAPTTLKVLIRLGYLRLHEILCRGLIYCSRNFLNNGPLYFPEHHIACTPNSSLLLDHVPLNRSQPSISIIELHPIPRPSIPIRPLPPTLPLRFDQDASRQ